MLSGSGGNIAVLQGKHDNLMVDGGIRLSHAPLDATLAKVGTKYVINTHWDWDHADNNGWLHANGATVIALQRSLAN